MNMLCKNTFTQNQWALQPIYNRFIKLIFCLLLPGLFATTSFAEEATTITSPTLSELVPQLSSKSFKQKDEVIQQLGAISDARVIPILDALLEGSLYYQKSDQRVVFTDKDGGKYKITDPLSNESLGSVSKSTLKKITINNKLRNALRDAIAALSLTNTDPNARIEAIRQLIKSPDAATIRLLRNSFEIEKNSKVREWLITGIALKDINSTDETVRLAAIESLGESMADEANNALTTLLRKTDEGKYVEPSAKVRTAAKKALTQINDKRSLYALIEKLFFGLSLGSVLLLAAIGLAITFGVMGVINMAHGELIMLGAYTTYVIQLLMPNHIGLSVLIAIPAAFIVAGLVGILIERGVIRFLYGRPLETLLATFGISLILQQVVRSIFSPLNRSVETPEWMSGTLELNSALGFTFNRLYIILFSLMVFFALMMVLKKTVLGLQVRAVAQNRSMAKAIGVKTEWVDALTFGLGSGIAGVAGVALSQLTNVGPNMGQAYIIDSFMVVVFGGVGNLWGTLVGAMSLGVVNKFLEPWAGAVLAKILVLIFIILFIQKRPRGLFPQKGRAAEA